MSRAQTFSQAVTFGDSLLDNGNLFALSGNTFPPPPYDRGRFSNGPVSVELLAQRLQVPLADFALGGAFTDNQTVFDGMHGLNPAIPGALGIQGEINAYRALPVGDPNTYLFWDPVHPTETGQGLLANQAFVTVTPEPDIIAILFAVSVSSLLLWRPRRRRKA